MTTQLLHDSRHRAPFQRRTPRTPSSRIFVATETSPTAVSPGRRLAPVPLTKLTTNRPETPSVGVPSRKSYGGTRGCELATQFARLPTLAAHWHTLVWDDRSRARAMAVLPYTESLLQQVLMALYTSVTHQEPPL